MISEELKVQFREGFYNKKPAFWLENIRSDKELESPRITKFLKALKEGKRDFSYPGHDRVVYNLLDRLISHFRLENGADIGCATGCFPAMQIACGIKRCTVFEVRPIKIDHPQIDVKIQDLSTPVELKAEFDLITCLSTIEHVGLGRYGDPLDPLGDLKLASNIRKLVRPGGIVLMSFPVGIGTVVYNLHRIYSPFRISKLLEGYTILESHWDRSFYRMLKLEIKKLFLGPLDKAYQRIYVLRVV